MPKNTRWLKIHRLSQAHLAPGMSLHRWQEILTRHGVLPLSSQERAAERGAPGVGGEVWSSIPDATLDALVAEISAIVRAAQQEPK